MAGRLAGKTAIVTGGSRGIGEGILRVFAREGANVVFCGLPSHNQLADRLVTSVSTAPGAALAYLTVDLTKPEGAKALVDAALSRFGRLDVVVNNAGFHPHAQPIDDFTLDGFTSLLSINLIAPWYLSKVAMPHLRATRGSVINISSISGYFGQAGSSTYCATKGGLVGMTKALAIDEAPHGVRVNAISPGNVWTPLWAEHVEGPNRDADIAAGNSAQVMGRMGTPHEIGEVALHLAAEATFTTGTEYICSGGAELGYGVKAKA